MSQGLYRSAFLSFQLRNCPCWTSLSLGCSWQSVQHRAEVWCTNQHNLTDIALNNRIKLTLNPPPTSPITFSIGTGTLSKDTSQAEKSKRLITNDMKGQSVLRPFPSVHPFIQADHTLTVGAPDAQFVLRLAAGDAPESPLHDKGRNLIFLHAIYNHLGPGKHCHNVCHASVWNPNLIAQIDRQEEWRERILRCQAETFIEHLRACFLSPSSRWSGNVFHLLTGLRGSEWRLHHFHWNDQRSVSEANPTTYWHTNCWCYQCDVSLQALQSDLARSTLALNHCSRNSAYKKYSPPQRLSCVAFLTLINGNRLFHVKVKTDLSKVI